MSILFFALYAVRSCVEKSCRYGSDDLTVLYYSQPVPALSSVKVFQSLSRVAAISST